MDKGRSRAGATRMMPMVLAAAVLSVGPVASARAESLADTPEVVIHEVAWAGTTVSSEQQWFELYNPGGESISLEGWRLRCGEGDQAIPLSGEIGPDDVVVWIAAAYPDLPGVLIGGTFEGPLCRAGGRLLLEDEDGHTVDLLDRRYAGDAATRATMQRVQPYRAGNQASSWATSRVRYDVGYGTPGFQDTTRLAGQHLYAVYHAPGTVNVYFNQPALTKHASEGNEANHSVNMEERILHRLRRATNTIDITVYELNLPKMVELLISKAAEGVRVRLIADSKEPSPSNVERVERWERARMYLELLRRGRDGTIGTDDDVIVFANAPIFAYDADAERREAFGLPPTTDDIPYVSARIEDREAKGCLLVKGEQQADGSFYRPGNQMHDKFIILDDRWVWTGSMNFTVTDLYGSQWNKRHGLMEGNSNNGLEIHSPALAAVYRAEFEQMWGGDGPDPVPAKALFSSRKTSQGGPHRVKVGERTIGVYFSPQHNVVEAMREVVKREAREKLYFAIFAWSDYELERILKIKWEGDAGDMKGERTGFELRGLFEFWDYWWSASSNMRGMIVADPSVNNPNVRWKHPPSIYRPNEKRRLHHKYMIIDADTEHNPMVITGSANWSANANTSNDENSLFIEDDEIANQYVQDFYAMYRRAGGTLD